MASLGRKNRKMKRSLVQPRLKSVVIGHKLDTVDINGVLYFSCQVCNRLVRDEKVALDHSQKCKPRIYSFIKDKIIVENDEKNPRDPYEIIPEEMDLEDQMTNNNSIKQNKNKSEGRLLKKCGKNRIGQYQNEELIVYSEIQHNNIDTPILKRITRNAKKFHEHNGQEELDNGSDSLESTSPHSRLSRKVKGRGKTSPVEESTPKSKKTTPERAKRKINSKQVTKPTIEERLRKISERLKKHKAGETLNDDDEEEERKAIEERLSALNKESEICGFNEADIENAKEEENISTENKEVDLVLRGLQDKNCQLQCYTDLQTQDASLSNAIRNYEENNTDAEYGTLVITQQPDGELHGCKKCPEFFLTALELLRHTRMKHTYPKIFMAPSVIEKFMALKDKSQCPICGKPLTPAYKAVYEKHLQTHSWVAEHECSICKKKFKRRDHMKVHEKRHIV